MTLNSFSTLPLRICSKDTQFKLIETFNRLYLNGGSHCFVFRSEDVEAYQSVITKRTTGFETMQLFRAFFTHPTVKSALAHIQVLDSLPADYGFRWMNSFCLEGELLSIILYGGIHKQYGGSLADAKEIASDFCNRIIGPDPRKVHVFKSTLRIGLWFHDISDASWMIIREDIPEITLLVTSDCD